MKPLVSVIIPAYNCSGTIGQAIDSALRQEVDLEILVINDRSPEDLDPVMEQYKKEPRVRYIKNGKNLGAAGSRNRGILLAEGEYAAFLDADDWWEEGKLKKQLELLEKDGTVLCSTGRELVTPEGVLTGRRIGVERNITYRKLLRHNCINCSSVLIRKDVALEFPMQHEDSHEDYIMWLAVLKKYKRASGINEPLLKYRLSNSGKSGNKFKSAKMTYTVYRYSGFSLPASVGLFLLYSINGLYKYAKAYLKLG